MKTFNEISNISYDNTINLSNNPQSLDNFNVFNLLNAFWIHCWNIAINDRLIFVLWTNNVIASFLFACLSASLISNEYSIWKIIGQILLSLFACVISIISYGCFIKINSLIPFLTLVYLLVLFNTNNTNNKSLFLFLVLVSLVTTDYMVTFFLVILLWITTIFYFIKHGISPLGNGAALLAPIFLMIGALLNQVNKVVFVSFCFITLLMPFLIFKLNNNQNLNFAYSSLNNWILKNNRFIAYLGIVIIALAVIIGNIFIFNDMYHWKIPLEKYDLFFAFHISKLGNYQVSIIFLIVVNACLFTLYLCTTIFYFVFRKKNKNIHDEEALAILVITFVVFCNFLSAHIINTFFDPLVLTFVNYVPLMAIIAFLYKTIYNTNQQISLWKYDWY